MKKTAKFIFTGIFYFLLASSCNAQSSAQSIIDKFFSDYEKSGPKESVENVRHDAKLAPEWISKLIFQLLNNFEK